MPVRRVQDRVPEDDQDCIALAALPPASKTHGLAPSRVADYIWPEHGMSSQGAALAAGRVLARLRARGKARLARSGHGWVRT